MAEVFPCLRDPRISIRVGCLKARSISFTSLARSVKNSPVTGPPTRNGLVLITFLSRRRESHKSETHNCENIAYGGQEEKKKIVATRLGQGHGRRGPVQVGPSPQSPAVSSKTDKAERGARGFHVPGRARSLLLSFYWLPAALSLRRRGVFPASWTRLNMSERHHRCSRNLLPVATLTEEPIANATVTITNTDLVRFQPKNGYSSSVEGLEVYHGIRDAKGDSPFGSRFRERWSIGSAEILFLGPRSRPLKCITAVETRFPWSRA